MSYTGFFAETDLYEVAKGGDSTKGSWVVPVSRADGISEDDFVRHTDETTGESRAVLYRQGEFVFRLAGRERQQSASYYTPEVLTRFTVSQALAELLDADGRTTTAEDILSLTICEPALGSGAFVIEAVRQLAEEYLTRRQSELGVRIDPDDYPRELQRVKAWIALHRVHGVDLNATAVESPKSPLARHHGRRARSPVVRTPPPPRQLPHRRPSLPSIRVRSSTTNPG